MRKVRRNLPGVSGCKDVGRDGTSPHCHCEERSDVAIRSPAVAQSKEQYLRQTRKSVYEFARSSASLPGISAGTRIATPVCALVRNDMQKFAGCLRNTRALPGECRETYLLCVRVTVLCMSLRGAKRRGNPLLLAVEHDRKQHFRRIRKSCEFAGTPPHSRPVIRCGLL